MLTWRVPDGVTEIGETGLVASVGLGGVPVFLCISQGIAIVDLH